MTNEKKAETETPGNAEASLLDSLDNDRLAFLRNLKDVQIISHALFQHEARRLSRKLGNDHPRVQQLQARLQENVNFIQDLEIQQEISEIRVPEVGETDALIHGRLVDENRRGIAGLTVFLENEAGNMLRFLGTSQTDKCGYYALAIDAAALARLSEKQCGEVYLAVCTPKGKVIYRDTNLLKLTEGARVLTEIPFRRRDLTPIGDGGKPVDQGNNNGEPQQPEKPCTDPNLWVVYGRVKAKDGLPLSGLTVSLFDQDCLFDDLLGTTVTKEEGDFRFEYRTEDFQDLFEASPDLYVKVTDQAGNTLYSSRKTIKCEAGREEVFNITIKKTMTGGAGQK